MRLLEKSEIQTKTVEIFDKVSFTLFIEEDYVAVDNMGLVWAFASRPIPLFGMWEAEKQPRYLGQVELEEDEKWYNLLFVF